MIWITQALCPRRHCAYATAWDDADLTRADAEAGLTARAAEAGLRPRCGICHGELHLESGPTRWATLEEALPHIRALEAENLRTRRELDRLGLTREPFQRPPDLRGEERP
jgi:hypothetical protein